MHSWNSCYCRLLEPSYVSILKHSPTVSCSSSSCLWRYWPLLFSSLVEDLEALTPLVLFHLCLLSLSLMPNSTNFICWIMLLIEDVLYIALNKSLSCHILSVSGKWPQLAGTPCSSIGSTCSRPTIILVLWYYTGIIYHWLLAFSLVFFKVTFRSFAHLELYK